MRRPVGYLLWLGLAAFLAVVCVIYAVAWRKAPVLELDSGSYMRLAQELGRGSLDRLSQRTPGFPLLLLLTGSAEHPTRLLFYVSLALHALGVLLGAYLLRRFKARPAVVAVFALVAMLPIYVEPSAWVLTENLSQFTVLASYGCVVLWIVSGRKAFAGAFVLAGTYAALVRPTYQALVPVMAITVVACMAVGLPAVAGARRTMLYLGAATVASCTVLGAYSLFNYERFGFFGMSSMSAYSVTHKTASFVEELPERYAGLREILVRYRDRSLLTPLDDHTAQNYIYRALPEVIRYYHGDELQALKAVQAASVTLIRNKPLSYLNDSLRLLGPYWMPTECVLANGDSAARRAFWSALQLAVAGAFFVQFLFMAGVYLLLASFRLARRSVQSAIAASDCAGMMWAHALGTALILYTMLISCFFGIGSARYRTPTDLLIILTTLLGYTIWARLLRAFGLATAARQAAATAR